MKLERKLLACSLLCVVFGWGGLFGVIVSLEELKSDSGVGLRPCPSSPNCVSSLASESDSTHFIEPFKFGRAPEAAWNALKSAVLSLSRVTIVKESRTYLHVEARTLFFRFVDDVEFELVSSEEVIHVRSSSRLGYGDLGVNRRRVEKIRARFIQLNHVE